MKKQITQAIAALAALAASGIAAAQQSQGYVGLQVGSARSDLDCSGASSCKTSDTGVKAFGGYRLTPEWAVELGYTDLGKSTASGTVNGTPATASVATTSLGFGVAYQVAFNNDWSGVIRAGIAANRLKISGTVGTASGSDSQTKAEPYVGLGIGYALSKQVSLTANWDWTQSEFSKNGASFKPKYNVYSLGVNFAF